jgi:hypothetical protein
MQCNTVHFAWRIKALNCPKNICGRLAIRSVGDSLLKPATVAGLPLNGTTASRHRRPQVPLSRNYRRAMPPTIADAGEIRLTPIR